MKYFKKIIGNKLYLSPINTGDYEQLTEWLNDINVTIYLYMKDQIITLEKEKAYLEKISKEKHHFALINLENDKLIGDCGLLNVDYVHRSAELGIMIGDRAYWNQGYGSDAVNLMLDYGFSLLNLNSIYILTFSFNQRAIACYKKSGFKEVGRRREAHIIGQKKYDLIIMDILAEEFSGTIQEYIKS